jgi:hypothetical protein
MNTLGVAHYRAGDWNAAIVALEKSVQLDGGSAHSWNAFFLAMAHWQIGKKEQAHTWYDQGVQWMQKADLANWQLEELRRFRAEAEQVLGIQQEKPSK